MKEFIEIPFGAKDSELGGWEYNIPEGFVASIENGKIVVKKEESEDEKIRKEIINYFKCQSREEPSRKDTHNKWLAWLENVKTPFINNTDNSFICDIKNIIDEAPGVLQSDKNRLIAWLEKQKAIDVLDVEEREFADNVNSYRKDMEEFYKKGYDAGREAEKQYWLGKQNEQKDSVVDFKAKDWYVSKVDGKIHNIYHSVVKVEPKFHEGDWIVDSNGKVNQVTCVNQYGDGYTLDDETYMSGSWCNSYHLWTIKDAKDGDVLVGDKDDVILIFRGIGNIEWDDVIDYHCYYDCHRENFIIQEDAEYWGNIKNNQLKPATKEQCDFLFQKIKEAGYKWDNVKKKLKKQKNKQKSTIEMITPEESLGIDSATYNKIVDECIYGEQNHAWSEEDKNRFRNLIWLVNQSNENRATKEGFIKFINRLKSLKKRVQPQQKKWSEEDEENLNQLHKFIVEKAYREYEIDTDDETLYGKWLKLDNWLKSLKPQPQWKPSEKHIKYLQAVVNDVNNIGSESCCIALKDLLEQLKKL